MAVSRGDTYSLLFTFRGQVLWLPLISREAGTYVVPGRSGNKCDEHPARVCHKRFDQGHITAKGQK